jgi:hypothetical protein
VDYSSIHEEASRLCLLIGTHTLLSQGQSLDERQVADDLEVLIDASIQIIASFGHAAHPPHDGVRYDMKPNRR